MFRTSLIYLEINYSKVSQLNHLLQDEDVWMDFWAHSRDGLLAVVVVAGL